MQWRTIQRGNPQNHIQRAMIYYTYYQASVSGMCWKQHQCVECGCTFRYVMLSTQHAKADTADDAAWSAERRLEASLHEDVGQCPCPACGAYQPDMIGGRQYSAHGALLVAQTVVLGIVLAVVQLGALGPWSAGAVAVFAGAHLWLALRNRNANPAANRERLKRRAERGEIAVEQVDTGDAGHADGRGVASRAVPRQQGVRAAGAALMVAGAVFFVFALSAGLPWYAGAAGIVVMDIAAYIFRSAGFALSRTGLPAKRIPIEVPTAQ